MAISVRKLAADEPGYSADAVVCEVTTAGDRPQKYKSTILAMGAQIASLTKSKEIEIERYNSLIADAVAVKALMAALP